MYRGASLSLGVQRFARFFGTLAPALRAGGSPIAIAGLPLVAGVPQRPRVSVPRVRACRAGSTLLRAVFP
jgi:hypothetical protein